MGVRKRANAGVNGNTPTPELSASRRRWWPSREGRGPYSRKCAIQRGICLEVIEWSGTVVKTLRVLTNAEVRRVRQKNQRERGCSLPYTDILQQGTSLRKGGRGGEIGP